MRRSSLVAVGAVTLISGNNSTTGDTLYYDDEKEIAYVSGKPAKNVNKKDGSTISGTTIVNNTKLSQVKLGSAFAVPLDVADETSVIAAFDAAQDTFGPIDGVVANAGITEIAVPE